MKKSKVLIKILVTGATGFIGSELVKILSKKYLVRCLVRRNLKVSSPNLEIIRGNLHSGKILDHALKDVSIIVHLAAIKYNINNLKKMEKTNVGGTANLIKRAKKAHFIYGSTWLAHYPEKTGYYGQTKRMAEDLIKKSNVNYTILRFPHIYSHKLINKITTKYILPVYLGLRYKIRPIYHPIEVRELCQAIEKVINNKKYYQGSFYIKNAKTLIPFT